MHDSISLLSVSVVDVVNHFYIVPFSILSIFPAHLIKCLLQVSDVPLSIFITKLKHPLPPPYSTIPIRFASHHDAVPKSPSMTSPVMPCSGDVPVPLALLLLFFIIAVPVARGWVTRQTSGGIHLSPDAPVNRMKRKMMEQLQSSFRPFCYYCMVCELSIPLSAMPSPAGRWTWGL